ISEYDRVTAEGGRLSDVLSGYIDPDDNIAAPTEEVPIPGAKAAAAKEEEDEDDENAESSDDEEEAESGPDPVVAAQRFGAVNDQLVITLKVLKKHGRTHA
ncbi:sigma-70 non-essential region-containing protein, partial [Enterobacter hormaechei]|nr:sigma-70 non-essential region-containing protein [Enterobacter hormaechei]